MAGYPKGMNRKAKGTTGDTTVRVSFDIRDWLNELKMEGETVNDVENGFCNEYVRRTIK